MIRLTALLALFTFAAPLAAKEPVLVFPVDCTLGETCFVQQYVDRDDGPDVTDFTCGALSYDGHKGTDFALLSLKAMQTGVNVLAAASGTVTATRNGMADILHDAKNAADIDGKECGNGVVIRHSDGWESQYCHMKQGSITVKKGQHLTAGQVLGQIGLSGKTQFPHLHLSVRKNDQIIDPFDADQKLTCNDPEPHSLWKNDIAYAGSGIIQIGFDAKIPKYAAIKSGENDPAKLQTNSPALVLWGYAFGGLPGDKMVLNIDGPKGTFSHQKVQIKKKQSQYFRAAGKRNKMGQWPAGVYTGTVILLRDNIELDQRKISIEIK